MLDTKKDTDRMDLTREQLKAELIRVFEENFEIENPGLDDDLREEYEFDSIDAIELLVEIEQILGVALSQEEKKAAMHVRTIHQICDYVESLARSAGIGSAGRSPDFPPPDRGF